MSRSGHSSFSQASQPLSDVITRYRPRRGRTHHPVCAGTARDVLLHLMETQRDFLTHRGLWPAEDTDPSDDPAELWLRYISTVDTLLSSADVADQPFEGFFGPTAVAQTMLDFYGWDMVVHRWDTARATGGNESLSESELDLVEGGARGFGDALYSPGICSRPVQVPDGASRQVQVQVLLGRAAQ